MKHFDWSRQEQIKLFVTKLSQVPAAIDPNDH